MVIIMRRRARDRGVRVEEAEKEPMTMTTMTEQGQERKRCISPPPACDVRGRQGKEETKAGRTAHRRRKRGPQFHHITTYYFEGQKQHFSALFTSNTSFDISNCAFCPFL